MSQREYDRHNLLKNRFHMTLLQYGELLARQNGRCAVCREKESAMGRHKEIQNLAVDHCHSTQKIRGLLCQRCNHALGMVRDNAELLHRLASYVETADTGLKAPGSSGDQLLEELLRK